MPKLRSSYAIPQATTPCALPWTCPSQRKSFERWRACAPLWCFCPPWVEVFRWGQWSVPRKHAPLPCLSLTTTTTNMPPTRTFVCRTCGTVWRRWQRCWRWNRERSETTLHGILALGAYRISGDCWRFAWNCGCHADIPLPTCDGDTGHPTG